MRVTSNLSILGIGYCLSILLSGCGGRSSSPLPPPISVSLSQTSATVQAGATANFTANVSNDSTNSGVKWSVSCPTASCGTVSPVTTASGASTTYSAPRTPPTNNVTVAVMAASVADPTKTASAIVTFPAILVSVSPGTAVVQAAATEQLAAAVSYDPSGGGVTWAVSCPTAPCGTLSTNSTPSGTAITYTAPTTLPVGATITVTATSVADTSRSNSATLIPVGHIAGYDVGVDYHAYGLDIDATGFIAIYNQAQVRQTVQQQLQGMADRGATSIQTAIWVAKGPKNTCCSTAQVHFPMTAQEQANLRAYAQDVASVVSASGNRLRLDIALNWLADADFTIGSPTTTLGPDNLSPADFASRVQTTGDQVLAAVGDVTRPDGVKLVDTIFFDFEPNIPAPGEPDGTPNIGWFLTTNYPHFVSGASQAGVRPSIYFIGCGPQDVVLDNSFVDSVYSILNGHRSMFWVYRGLKFMVDTGLPLPAGRVAFDCYFDSSGATYAQLLQRILDDADATLPSLGAPKVYDIPETYYLADPTLRLQYGQAFAAQAAQNPRLQRLSFWTTPGPPPGESAAYPFTIEDFLPLSSPPPAVPSISTQPQSKQRRLRPPDHPARLRSSRDAL
jgi:hypothetical protein